MSRKIKPTMVPIKGNTDMAKKALPPFMMKGKDKKENPKGKGPKTPPKFKKGTK